MRNIPTATTALLCGTALTLLAACATAARSHNPGLSSASVLASSTVSMEEIWAAATDVTQAAAMCDRLFGPAAQLATALQLNSPLINQLTITGGDTLNCVYGRTRGTTPPVLTLSVATPIATGASYVTEGLDGQTLSPELVFNLIASANTRIRP